MGKGYGRHSWLIQIAIVVGYVALYSAVRPVSGAHWALTAGLRLACLLIFPYRYWLALAIGDTIPLVFQAVLCYPQFGAAWATLYVFPPIALVMPIVWWCRERLSLFPSSRVINFKALLGCILGTSLAWALVNFVTVALANQTASHHEPVELVMVLGLFLGKYIAILTVVPWVLIAKVEYKSGALVQQLMGFAKSRLALDTAILLLPALCFLSWFSVTDNEQTRQVLRMLMFWPVAWLTLKHGWRAAVLGSTLAIACICLLLADTPDAEVIQAQAFVAFIVTCMFALGARITAVLHEEERERIDGKRALQLARKSIHVNEQRLRQASQQMELAASALQLTQNRLLSRFRHMMPIGEGQSYYREAANLQNEIYRIANSIHPIAWRERGLPAALRDTLARALDEKGVAYSCEIKGRGFTTLNAGVHTALYRFACESIVHVLGQQSCSNIRLWLRAGETHGARWAVLRVEGTHDANSEEAPLRTDEGQRLASKLGASGMSVEVLRDHARIYNGELHVKNSPARLRMTVLLHDVETEKRGLVAAPAPQRLWVR
jgi:two-component system, NarL family, sensor histidine kinase FusK